MPHQILSGVWTDPSLITLSQSPEMSQEGPGARRRRRPDTLLKATGLRLAFSEPCEPDELLTSSRGRFLCHSASNSRHSVY